jgi:very-short-patch-repair endonuclease
MPFSRVTKNFHPVRDKFDVIIVDEASQEDVLGLVPLYMAKKVIVVGDDEQVTPLDVGGLQEPIQQLINQWLVDLPSFNLFDLKTSVYDRAQIAFGSVIRLKEHFRCVPEIIQFSNSLCYNYTIKPLRESASTIVKPALVAHRVQGFSDGKVNKTEAQEIVDLISACVELPEYDGKSIGVISMVGEKQSDLISDMLRNRLPPAVYDQRRILCGNPAQFQGDERDIIFLSLVDSKDDGEGPLSLKQDGADGMYKKRFNVASSRAKDQLWVVYSLDAQTQLKPNDIRRRLIEHAVDPSSLMNHLNAGLVKTESPFEAEVFKILSGHGYRVTPQWQVGAYRIDMVAEGNGKRLAIECDGERWHYDKAEEDLARQALLERLGWTFVRIRGSVFYRDKTHGREVALRPLMQRLKEIGIDPFNETISSDIAAKAQTLADEVIQRAAEIRVRTSQSHGASVSNAEEVQIVEQSAVGPIFSVLEQTKEIVTPQAQTATTVELVQAPLFAAQVTDTKPVTFTTSMSPPDVFYEGARVRHEKFGLGTIIAVKQYGGSISELDIGFDALSEIRTLHPSSVKLRK